MYALVLAGGGAKGAYQIGVWKALRELKIEVGLVVGTSVGALNGGFFAQNDYDKAVDVWKNMSMENVFHADEEIMTGLKKALTEGIFKNNLSFYRKMYSYMMENKGLDITPLRTRIQDILDEDKIRNSGIDFGFVTFSITNMKPLKLFLQDIPYGELKYYLIGSALVPGFSQDPEFPMKFMDGGVKDRFPIKMAIDKGYDKIIAVETKQRKLKKIPGKEVVFIAPSEDLGNFLYFNKKNSEKNFQMGYLDALKAFNQLDGKMYFFRDFPEEKDLIKKLAHVDTDMLETLMNTENKRGYTVQKYFLEKYIPTMEKTLFGEPSKSYKHMVIGLLELLLEKNKIERLCVYTPKMALAKLDYKTLDNASQNIYNLLYMLF